MDEAPGAGGIPLAQMIQELRRELQASERASAHEGLRFKVEGVELELQVGVSREAEGEGGIKFWVVNLGGRYKQGREDVHTFKLKLLPVSGSPQGELLVTGTEREKPG
jgi:hypothetical protein